jgi:hypothetical protein
MTLAGCLQPSSGFHLVSFWLKLTIADLEQLKTVFLASVESFMPFEHQQHPQSFDSLLAELTTCLSRLS